MMVYSTVLEVNGRPTLYSVYKNGNTAFLNPARKEKAPILFATQDEADWKIRGTEDELLVYQVKREIVD